MGKHIEDIAQSDSEGCQKQIKDALANPFPIISFQSQTSSDHQKGTGIYNEKQIY